MYRLLVENLLYKNSFNDKYFSDLLREIDELNGEELAILTALLSRQLQNPVDLSLFVNSIYKTREIDYSLNLDCIDICGTGGSGFDRVNTSTLIAFVLASLGIRIAKHGNRAGAGRFGSFDLIEKLEIPIVQNKKQIEESLKELNLALIFAPTQYPVFKYFASARKALKTASVFNLVGPLLNPLKPKVQFIGSSYPQFSSLLYETGKKLGREKLYIYGAEHGLDDISTVGNNYIFSDDGNEKISAADFNVNAANIEQIAVKSVSDKVSFAKSLIEGSVEGPLLDLVLINAAFVYSKLKKLKYIEAYQLIKSHITEGNVKSYIVKYKELLNDYS